MCGLLSILLSISSIQMIYAIHCGFPGRPAYGRALQVADSYSEGQAVTYTCNSGYYMVGTVIRRCLPNGTWTGYIPVCDTTLSPVGYTSSSEALALYPSEMAIDSNKKTCFYSNRRKPRWWRMDMGVVQTVISVAITVPFASSEHHFTIYVIEVNNTRTRYHKCASFRGIFSSQTMILSCGNMKGIVGTVLHVEDNSPHLDHFGLCEIEVFVRKDYYECGQPEVPTNSFLVDKPNNAVTYGCVNGYRLEGSAHRTCMRSGQWSGSQPICRQINCSRPTPIDNGWLRLISANEDSPTLGSRVIYSCKPGFTLIGTNDSQYCDENGLWTGIQPECHPIDCGPPEENSDYLGGRFQLLNRSTKFLSTAELICFNGKRPGIVIQCKDDGTWSDMDATCIFNKVNYYNANTSDSYREKKNDFSVLTIALVSAVMVVLLVLFLLIFFLFKKKLLQFKWATAPETSSRRPSWRAMELFRSTNIQFRRPFSFQAKCATKSQSIPSNSSIKSANNFENVYEEITNFNVNPITDETEDKIRRAAIIAAELVAIKEQKQLRTKSLSASQTPPLSLYSKVDLIQKHKDRLLRQQQLNEVKDSDDLLESIDTKIAINFHKRRLDVTDSLPELTYGQTSHPNYESIKFSSLDLGRQQTHLLKDNMIFVGHPGVGVTNCDNLSQVTQSGTTSDLKRVYTISS